MATLSNIHEHLASLSDNDWKRLFEFISIIESAKVFGTAEGSIENPDGSFQIPYYVPSELVIEFIHVMYDLDLVIAFDWPDWTEGRVIFSRNEFTGLDKVILLKLMSVILRKDRFCDGYLIGRMEDGTVLEILKELRNTVVVI